MPENKKRAKSFKNLTLVSACVPWKVSGKIKKLLKKINMVEAAGIEPASENRQPEAHTCLSPLLLLSLHPAPWGKLRNRPARFFLSSRPGRRREDQPGF